METILLVLHIALGLALIAIILLQQGAGATAGAAFGSGASSTVFGSRGSGSFLTRATAILALAFFANSFLLAYLSGQAITPESIIEQAGTSAPPSTGPAADAAATEPPVLPQKAPSDDLPDMPN